MKHLKLEVKHVKGWCTLLRIVEQTHRANEFGEDKRYFIASNGFGLRSAGSLDGYPQVTYSDIFYVRGCNCKKDNKVLIIPSEDYLSKLKVAVREYNEYFSDKRVEKAEDSDTEIIE